jgi:hypothetical protein
MKDFKQRGKQAKKKRSFTSAKNLARYADLELVVSSIIAMEGSHSLVNELL